MIAVLTRATRLRAAWPDGQVTAAHTVPAGTPVRVIRTHLCPTHGVEITVALWDCQRLAAVVPFTDVDWHVPTEAAPF